jgi:hypothetical protein
MRRALGFGLCLLGILFVGCANEAEVQGTVTIQGKALEGASVMFQTEDGNPVGTGVTDANGNFKLKSTQGKERIPAGNYVVTVIKSTAIQTEGGKDMDMAKMGEEMAKKAGVKPGAGPMNPMMKKSVTPLSKNLVPEKYSNSKSSPLKVTVPTKGPVELKLD